MRAKEEAEDLAQEMAELRYQITGLLEEECKRRACIEQASLQRIAQLEAQVLCLGLKLIISHFKHQVYLLTNGFFFIGSKRTKKIISCCKVHAGNIVAGVSIKSCLRTNVNKRFALPCFTNVIIPATHLFLIRLLQLMLCNGVAYFQNW